MLRPLFTALCATSLLFAGGAGAQDLVPREEIERGLQPVTGERAASVDLPVLFALNSAELTEAAVAQLGELAAAMQAETLASATFGVYGHTDSLGDADYNLELSQRRAEAVRTHLIKVHEISADRLIAEGFGETRPAFLSEPSAPRNRRVEIVVLSRGAPEPRAPGGGPTPIGAGPW